MLDADVIVCGLGPTGATAAALLARRGLRVIALEQRGDIFPLPRAIGWDHETMRILQEIGVIDAVLPFTAPYRPSEYRGVQGQTIRRIVPAPPPQKFGWQSNYVFDQPGFERALRHKLESNEAIEAIYRATLKSFVQSSDSVTVTFSAEDAADQSRTAHFLLACDGGGSPIRKALGVALEDLGFDEYWLVVDADVVPEKLADLPQTQVQYCEPGRPCSFVIGPGNHRRWEIMLLPGDSLSPDFPEAELWPLLSRWIAPGDAVIRRAAAYRFHGLVTTKWRRDRVLLLGDAAHMTPPFMSQGMVQGMRDAHNVAWKIERIVAGKSPVELLDTYGLERRPHVVTVTQAAIKLGREICERDPAAAELRDQRLLATAVNGVLPETVRQTLIPPLGHGPLISVTPGAGELCPQPRVMTSVSMAPRLLDDLSGVCTRLIVLDTLAPMEVRQLTDTLHAVDGRLVQVVDVLPSAVDVHPPAPPPTLVVEDRENILRSWLQGTGRRFALVRPDHYVYGTAGTTAEALELVSRWATQLCNPIVGDPALEECRLSNA